MKRCKQKKCGGRETRKKDVLEKESKVESTTRGVDSRTKDPIMDERARRPRHCALSTDEAWDGDGVGEERSITI